MDITTQDSYANFFVTKNVVNTLLEGLFSDESANSLISTLSSHVAKELTGFANEPGAPKVG